jgi:hypothetical protein
VSGWRLEGVSEEECTGYNVDAADMEDDDAAADGCVDAADDIDDSGADVEDDDDVELLRVVMTPSFDW